MSRGLLASPLRFFAGWATLCPHSREPLSGIRPTVSVGER